jgi:hypothetical protein
MFVHDDFASCYDNSDLVLSEQPLRHLVSIPELDEEVNGVGILAVE